MNVGCFCSDGPISRHTKPASRPLSPPAAGESQDTWWQRNLGKALTIWALVEAPSMLGLVGYLVTHDFRVLLATLAGLLLFGNFRPSRLLER